MKRQRRMNEEQTRAVALLEKKDDEYKAAYREAEREIRKKVERDLLVLRIERSQIANACLGLGVSKRQIGEALGTSDWSTVTSVLALTSAPTLEPGEVTVFSSEAWTFDSERLEMTLTMWPNFRTRVTDKKPLIVHLHHKDGEGTELRAMNALAEVYQQGADLDWFDTELEKLNVQLGYVTAPQAEVVATVPAAADYDEMFRQAALHANDDEDED